MKLPLLRTALLIVAMACGSAPAVAQDVTVFAAASLTDALQQVGKLYKEGPVRFSFAASSTLAKQIESGAEADIFASADEQWMDYLAERKLIVTETRSSRLGNALVLITPPDQKRTVDI